MPTDARVVAVPIAFDSKLSSVIYGSNNGLLAQVGNALFEYAFTKSEDGGRTGDLPIPEHRSQSHRSLGIRPALAVFTRSGVLECTAPMTEAKHGGRFRVSLGMRR